MSRTQASQYGIVASLVLLTAGMWWGWFAWDVDYQRDPVTGEVSGPYELWQGIGCAICWIVLAVVAEKFLRPTTIVLAMPISFTIAYAFTVIPSDKSGLSAVGVILAAIGTFAGTLTVMGAANGVHRFASRGVHRMRR